MVMLPSKAIISLLRSGSILGKTHNWRTYIYFLSHYQHYLSKAILFPFRRNTLHPYSPFPPKYKRINAHPDVNWGLTCDMNLGPMQKVAVPWFFTFIVNKGGDHPVDGSLSSGVNCLSLDELVMLGNHRDAWVFGAADASSGTAAMMELSRVLGEQLKKGILRDIYFKKKHLLC